MNYLSNELERQYNKILEEILGFAEDLNMQSIVITPENEIEQRQIHAQANVFRLVQFKRLLNDYGWL